MRTKPKGCAYATDGRRAAYTAYRLRESMYSLSRTIGLDFIVKLGGSAITDKDSLETPKAENLEKVTTALGQSWKRGAQFVVVHGAGYVSSVR